METFNDTRLAWWHAALLKTMEIFALMSKLHMVRVVLSLATNLSWELWQMDAKNAFHQGELEEEVYMNPPRIEDTIAPKKILRLGKLYMA